MAHFGLTPRKYQPGAIDVTGSITKAGDAMMRSALYEAAHSMLTRVKSFSNPKRWAMAVAQTPRHPACHGGPGQEVGDRSATHVNGTDSRFGKEEASAA